jgi:hypothetical protein
MKTAIIFIIKPFNLTEVPQIWRIILRPSSGLKSKPSSKQITCPLVVQVTVCSCETVSFYQTMESRDLLGCNILYFAEADVFRQHVMTLLPSSGGSSLGLFRNPEWRRYVLSLNRMQLKPTNCTLHRYLCEHLKSHILPHWMVPISLKIIFFLVTAQRT